MENSKNPGAAAAGSAMLRSRIRAGRRRSATAVALSCAVLGSTGAAAGVVGSAMLAVAPVQAPVATAATYNQAYGGYDSTFGGWLGAVELPNGLLAYCLQPASGDATGNNIAKPMGGYVDAAGNPLPDDATAKLGYVFDTYGQVRDKVTNQAVALYAYAWTGSVDGSHPLGSGALGLKYDGTGNPAVAAKFHEIWNDANDPGHYSTGPSTGSGYLQFDVDPTNNFDGTVTMVGTAGSTGTIALTNGVVKGTDANVIPAVGEGVVIAIESAGGKTADGKLPAISGTGTFTPPGGGWGPGLQVWESGGGQDVGSGGQKIVPGPFTVAGADPAPRITPWVKTKARPAVTVGNVNKDDFTWGLLPPQGADLKIVFYADKTCSIPVYTFETHLSRPESGPNQGVGSTDEFEVKDEWVDQITGETIGHFTEQLAVPEYGWESVPSECGQEGENTKMTRNTPPPPSTPPSIPPATPPSQTPPPTPELPVVAG